jgi:hypothetical protein
MKNPTVPEWRAKAPAGVSLASIAPKAQPKNVTVIHRHEFIPKPMETMHAGLSGSYLTNQYAAFEALSNSDDRTPILVNALGPMLSGAGRWLPAPTLNFQRLLLSSISRYLYDNNGPVSYGVDLLRNYSVPVVPKAATSEAALNEELDEYFCEWAKTADFSGRFNFWKLQEIASIAADCDGDIGFAMVSENGFPQLQTLEGWRIGSLKSYSDLRIVDGVVLDKKGAVAGFIVQQEEGDAIISASEMRLVGDSERFHNYRNLSAIRRGANDIRDHSDIKGFAKKSTKIAAALAAWISGGPLAQDSWGNDTGSADHPGTAPVDGINPDGSIATPQDQKISIANLLNGDIPVLPGNQVLNMLENKQPGILTTDFLRELAGLFICGLGLPPAFYNDEKLTGPNVRSVIGKARKKFNKRSEMFQGLAEWVYVRVIADAMNKKKVTRSPEFTKVKFQWPADIGIDLGDEAKNDREDVTCGQMTRQERYGKRAKDWQHEVDQTERELDYIFEKAKARSEKFNIPMELALSSYGITSKNPAPQPQGDQENNPAQQQ